MSDDTSAALIANLDVKFDQLASNMKKAIKVFDDGGRQLERRQKQVKKNISDFGLKFTGLDSLKSAFVGLTAVGIVGGIAALVKTSLDAAAAIGDTAQQAGVGVEFLQKLRFAAVQSGASFDIMDTALTTLNKSLGDYINTGAGKGATAFKTLGIDKLINNGNVRDAEQAFNAIAKGLQKYSSESVKASLLAGVFGKEAGPKLLQLMNEGAAGIAKLEAQAVSLGIVLSHDTVMGAKDAGDKLDALFSVIKAQGISAVASLAPEIANLTQKITDGLPDLILWVERWADWFGIIKLSPVDKLKTQISDIQAQISKADDLKSGFWTNPLGLMSMNIDAKKSELISKLKRLQGDLATESAKTPRYVVNGSPFPAALAKQHVALTPQEIALAAKRKELLAQTGVDAATASAALLVAQDTTNVQLLKGSEDYYAAVRKQIEDEYQAKVTTAEAEAAKQKATLGRQGVDWKGYADGVANINSALNDKLAAADEERKQKQFENGPSALIQQAIEQGRQQVEQYGFETAALGLTAGAAAKLAFIQSQLADANARQIPITAELIAAINAQGDAVGRAAQAAHLADVRSQDSIQITDELRSGLMALGVAGAHGFGSLKDSASQFLSTLADMIIQLYVMKPLLNSLFGESGTTGSGLIGSLISSIPGFANGTNNAPGGLAVVGERGPELVNLPRGSQVIPNVPTVSRSGAGGTTVQYAPSYNISGSNREEVSALLAERDRRMPQEIIKIVRDARSRRVL